MSRRKARELAFKVMFQVDQVNAEPRTAFEYLLTEQRLADSEKEFAWSLIERCLQNQATIDHLISQYANDWSIDRMSSVDRNLMRIASSEILFLEGSQAAVAIDEAIEISKKYGEDNSASFINAILDKIHHHQET
ncbi:MAG TPA: transcription antitermination factor NusB [Syntrophomonas sp.]|nr:transcription antitermination factor NusB [Syntrophomonas sp.]HRW12383.1 transcription antitermination factor NusB [Syntrophomonas sp.]